MLKNRFALKSFAFIKTIESDNELSK